ncbi:hypothetical protein V5799_028096 [Amblyomma americanum]|uniref:Uncharacterized protein n=1 Tax=Amblyomma americanum TaxID=6943 RepID=A0AAQ4DDV1_AMBAM
MELCNRECIHQQPTQWQYQLITSLHRPHSHVVRTLSRTQSTDKNPGGTLFQETPLFHEKSVEEYQVKGDGAATSP